MTTIGAVIFWLALAGVAWTYAGYPLLLLALAGLRPRPGRSPSSSPDAAFQPTVTVIISAYNEEKAIRQKLESTLALDYPADKLEVIVASDCSTDRTHDIVRQLAPRGVRLVVLPERAGKTAAQNLAAASAIAGRNSWPDQRQAGPVGGREFALPVEHRTRGLADSSGADAGFWTYVVQDRAAQ